MTELFLYVEMKLATIFFSDVDLNYSAQKINANLKRDFAWACPLIRIA